MVNFAITAFEISHVIQKGNKARKPKSREQKQFLNKKEIK